MRPTLETQLILAAIEFKRSPWRTFGSNLWRRCGLLTRNVSARRARKLRQQTAEEIVFAAHEFQVGPKAMHHAVAAVEAGGYSSLSRRVVVACVIAQWSAGRRTDQALAFRLIAEARRHLGFRRVKKVARTTMTEALDQNERALKR